MVATGADNSTPTKNSSRRTLLAGALGGIGAWAAGAISRASPVRAEGETMLVGGEYPTATSRTYLANAANDDTVLEASSAGNGTGVRGASGGGIGVAGASDTSNGVWGFSSHGRGVYGTSPNGVGVKGGSTNGYAIRGKGRVRFDRISGVRTIPAGSTGVTVSPGVTVTSGSFVLLSPKADLGARGLWFTTNMANNTFRIRISSSRSSDTKIGWLLMR